MKDRKAFTTLEDDAERPRMPRKAVHEQKQLDLSAEAKSKPTIEMETEDQFCSQSKESIKRAKEFTLKLKGCAPVVWEILAPNEQC